MCDCKPVSMNFKVSAPAATNKGQHQHSEENLAICYKPMKGAFHDVKCASEAEKPLTREAPLSAL